MRAYIVVDLGFGDSGKGLLTDFLVRHLQAGLVVRYNGGAQAGHNVVAPDGRHHRFSQFGSGTFVPGVQTFLSRHVVIHPGALLQEGEILEARGIRDCFSRLRVSDRALVITPFHQAANRIRELLRAAGRHGSCGVGVGEAVEDALLHPEDRIEARDLTRPAVLRRKARILRERKREQIAALGGDYPAGSGLAAEWQIFERADLIDDWISSIAPVAELGLVVPDSELEHRLGETENVVFEGAQGVLLDADQGFHPFTTWSRCTAANALDFITEMAPDSQVVRIGVMRSYAVRHGPGPLPTETDDLTSKISEHNQFGEWQGPVRYGWFDAVLARFALALTGGVDTFALTHLDLLPHLKAWKYCPGYGDDKSFGGLPVDPAMSDGLLASFQVPGSLTLAQRAELTQALSAVTPVLESCDTDERSVIQKIQSLIGHPVDLVSRGPHAGDVQIVTSLPT